MRLALLALAGLAALPAAAQGPQYRARAGAFALTDCRIETVTRGVIERGTVLGLQEVGSQSETQDYDELGDVTPQMRALTAFNPSTVHVPITRLAGVTGALSVPQGGLMPGTAALVTLHGYTPEQLATGFEGVVVNFPLTGRRGRFDRREQSAIDKAAKEANTEDDENDFEKPCHGRIS